jgi:hypothetical protein
MGNEAACTVRLGTQKSVGKALLETSELIFRPADGGARLKIPFSAMKSAKAVDGELRVETPNGAVVFELGTAAAKWCEKILHPKTRAEKLGLKPGMNVSLLGQFEKEFLRELRSAKANIHDGQIDPGGQLIFLGADSPKDLAAIGKVAKSVQGATGLWVVYPKAKKEITENNVIAAGRKTGLKDVKVVGFSTTHTALKFVVPVSKR